MANNTIITIGRQYGSGGHDIGKQLAEELNVPFYDKALLERAAKTAASARRFSKITTRSRPTASSIHW